MTAREGRTSEKTLSYIWSIMPHLQVTVWHPIEDAAIEHATDMMIALGKLITELKEQQQEKWKKQIKHSDQIIPSTPPLKGEK